MATTQCVVGDKPQDFFAKCIFCVNSVSGTKKDRDDLMFDLVANVEQSGFYTWSPLNTLDHYGSAQAWQIIDTIGNCRADYLRAIVYLCDSIGGDFVFAALTDEYLFSYATVRQLSCTSFLTTGDVKSITGSKISTLLACVLGIVESKDVRHSWLQELLRTWSTVPTVSTAIVLHYLQSHPDPRSELKDMYHELEGGILSKTWMDYAIIARPALTGHSSSPWFPSSKIAWEETNGDAQEVFQAKARYCGGYWDMFFLSRNSVHHSMTLLDFCALAFENFPELFPAEYFSLKSDADIASRIVRTLEKTRFPGVALEAMLRATACCFQSFSLVYRTAFRYFVPCAALTHSNLTAPRTDQSSKSSDWMLDLDQIHEDACEQVAAFLLELQRVCIGDMVVEDDCKNRISVTDLIYLE
jgi:hypothetical protein